MNTLDLSTEKAQVLAEFLESKISDMHSEIVHTSDHDFKQKLKHKREILAGVLQALKTDS